MARSKKIRTEDSTPTLSGRVVDYESLRPVAAASNILEISLAHFAAQSQGPLAGLDGRELRQEIKLRGMPTEAIPGQVWLTAVEFEFKALDRNNGGELCSVHGTFVVAYRLQALPDAVAKDTVSLFAEVNGMYHAWPYVRELVGSCTGRLGLGGVLLPIWLAPKHLPSQGEWLVLGSAAV